MSLPFPSLSLPLSVTNGLRAPTQPSVSNGGTRISYSYFISDGSTFSVQGSLVLSASTAFATTRDLLGNPYQTVTAVSGTRVYTYIPTGGVVTSTVTAIAAVGTADQRFYPYALLAAAPGVYSLNTAPFLDGQGVGFSFSPAAPALGSPVGAGTQYTSTSVFFATPESTAVVTELYYTGLPSVALQTQTYTFQ